MQCQVCGYSSQRRGAGAAAVNPPGAESRSQQTYASPPAGYPSSIPPPPTAPSGGWGAPAGNPAQYLGQYGAGAGAGRDRLRVDTLSIEKMVYLGLYVLNGVITVLATRATVLAQATAQNSTGQNFGEALIAASVVGVIIGFFILRAVLLGEDTLLKWGCISFCALAIAYWVWHIVATLGGSPLLQQASAEAGFKAAAVFSACFAIAMQVWLISILVRDARRVGHA